VHDWARVVGWTYSPTACGYVPPSSASCHTDRGDAVSRALGGSRGDPAETGLMLTFDGERIQSATDAFRFVGSDFARQFFASWVREIHPGDIDRTYTGEYRMHGLRGVVLPRLDPVSIGLWAQYTEEILTSAVPEYVAWREPFEALCGSQPGHLFQIGIARVEAVLTEARARPLPRFGRSELRAMMAASDGGLTDH
jgi:hypothetical protein